VFQWLVFCCASLCSFRTAKRLEVAGLCFAFVTVPPFRNLLRFYDTLAQFSLHSSRDGNALT
jgi:hypothetical protein